MLRQSAVQYMIELYDNIETTDSNHSQRIQYLVNVMNEYHIYVDKLALQYWLKVRHHKKTTYEDARLKVQQMFMNMHDKLKR